MMRRDEKVNVPLGVGLSFFRGSIFGAYVVRRNVTHIFIARGVLPTVTFSLRAIT